jgi:hypothetical protein
LSATLTDALLAPVAVGLKLTEIVQLAPAASEELQVPVLVKSDGFVPVMVMDVIEREAVPLFVRVTAFAALFVPTLTEPKLSDVGASLTTVPTPVREMVWVDDPPLSLIVTEPVLVPEAVGVKVMLIVQLPPGCTALAHVFVSWKSPVTAMLLIVS